MRSVVLLCSSFGSWRKNRKNRWENRRKIFFVSFRKLFPVLKQKKSFVVREKWFNVQSCSSRCSTFTDPQRDILCFDTYNIETARRTIFRPENIFQLKIWQIFPPFFVSKFDKKFSSRKKIDQKIRLTSGRKPIDFCLFAAGFCFRIIRLSLITRPSWKQKIFFHSDWDQRKSDELFASSFILSFSTKPHRFFDKQFHFLFTFSSKLIRANLFLIDKLHDELFK